MRRGGEPHDRRRIVCLALVLAGIAGLELLDGA